MSEKHYIIMGDIIRSRTKDAEALHRAFNQCIHEANQKFEDKILSGLTITLGDEFQGLVTDLYAALDLMFYIDAYSRDQQIPYKMRFALHLGEVETPVKKGRAHNMMGRGLTATRELLNNMSKRSKERFRIRIGNEKLDVCLENTLDVYDAITNSWNLEKDRRVIKAMIESDDDAKVAEKLGKTRQQIWKRRTNLMISEYKKCKQTALQLTGFHHD